MDHNSGEHTCPECRLEQAIKRLNMSKQVKVSDLPDLTNSSIFPQPFLVCACGEFSANKGDYFMAKKDHVLHCDECDEDMVLMTKRVVYEDWPKKEED